jgi:hypothetical protein
MTPLRACLGTAVAALLLPAVLPAAATLAPGQTQVSTMLFVNASNLQRTGAHTKDEGLGADLQRFYIDVQHPGPSLPMCGAVTATSTRNC